MPLLASPGCAGSGAHRLRFPAPVPWDFTATRRISSRANGTRFTARNATSPAAIATLGSRKYRLPTRASEQNASHTHGRFTSSPSACMPDPHPPAGALPWPTTPTSPSSTASPPEVTRWRFGRVCPTQALSALDVRRDILGTPRAEAGKRQMLGERLHLGTHSVPRGGTRDVLTLEVTGSESVGYPGSLLRLLEDVELPHLHRPIPGAGVEPRSVGREC
jgi:hypothetical protein